MAQAGFKPSVITKLPKLPAFIGARYDPQRNIVRVLYFFEQTETNTPLIMLSQQPAPVAEVCWLCSFWLGENNHPVDLDRFERVLPPASNLQTVQIGALTGQYVEGFWYKPAQECCYIWEPSPGFKTLRWQKDGMAYELSNADVTMTREEMIKVAENVK